MRMESEKKTKVTSLRLTEEQHQIVQAKAESKNLSMSSYIINTAVHGDKTLTPEIMVRMQNIVNTACEAVKEYAPKDCAFMQSEVNKLWSQLK